VEVNVENATSPSLSAPLRLALIGAATAFAWVVLSLVLGFGAGSAHADDADERPSLLGAVSEVVDSTANVAGTVVDTVVAVTPAPVPQPVRETVGAVGSVVTTAAEPVAGGVAGPATTPVVAVVTQVPVAGDVVEVAGLDDVVAEVGRTVDDSLGDLVATVADATSAIGQPVPASPVLPEIPGLPLFPALPDFDAPSDASAAAAIATGDATAVATAAWSASATGLLRNVDSFPQPSSGVTATSSVASAAGGTAAGAPGMAGELCPPATSSSGSGGAGPGALALLSTTRVSPSAAHVTSWAARKPAST
jgi:hypothetical protein